MFDIEGSKSIFDKANVKRIIFEADSVTVAFDEGYDKDGEFIPVGEDHITLHGKEATDFLADFKKAEKPMDKAAESVAAKRPVKVVEEPIEEPK